MSRTAEQILYEFGVGPPPTFGSGRYYAHCPECSKWRKGPRRSEKTLGVTIDAKGAKFGCNHCGWTNGAYYNGQGQKAEFEATYLYRDLEGKARFRVVRQAGKKIWRQYPVNGGWVNERPEGVDVPHIIYRLPEVREAIDAGKTIYAVEGEKDCDNLWARGIPATCNPGGASDEGKKPKWREEYSRHLHGADLIVLNDNDNAGRAHAEATAEMTRGIAKSVRRVQIEKFWPACPDKGDVSDWFQCGGRLEDLTAYADGLEPLSADVHEFTPPGRKLELLSSAAFVKNFTPPDYLVDGILQRRYCYSLTAPTGTGKTAILLYIMACVARGAPVGTCGTEAGAVCFLAGENPDDVRSRWIALAQHAGFDVEAIRVFFIEGVFPLADIKGVVTSTAKEAGVEFSLVIVDTSAAYDLGDDENSNAQMKKHARTLRSLVEMPGGPTVIAACHPTKNADPDNLLPRGGGSFVAEVDGNLTCRKSGEVVEMHWQGKFRGVDFAPVPFQIDVVTADKLRDHKGRLIPTVVAKTISEAEHTAIATKARTEEDEMLVLLRDHGGGLSIGAMAARLKWFLAGGKHFGDPHKTKVVRVLGRLKDEGLARHERRHWVLTEKGAKWAKKLD